MNESLVLGRLVTKLECISTSDDIIQLVIRYLITQINLDKFKYKIRFESARDESINVDSVSQSVNCLGNWDIYVNTLHKHGPQMLLARSDYDFDIDYNKYWDPEKFRKWHFFEFEFYCINVDTKVETSKPSYKFKFKDINKYKNGFYCKNGVRIQFKTRYAGTNMYSSSKSKHRHIPNAIRSRLTLTTLNMEIVFVQEKS